jgi:hypothetical protein
MNIAGQLQKIRIIFAHNRFIPVLEKMSLSFMHPVIIPHVPGKNFLHPHRQKLTSRPYQKVKVIGHERPGVNPEPSLFSLTRYPEKETIPVFVILKEFGSCDPQAHNVMEHSWSI